MNKVTCAVIAISFLALMAFAEVPYAPAPEDVSIGYCDPMIGPWASDLVTWTQQPNAPVTFRRAASAAIGNYWYCFGDQSVIPGNAFNLTTHQWEASTPPPLGNCNWTGIAVNGSIYIVGRYPYATDVQKFTPIGGGPTGTWTTVAPYPIAGCGIAAAWDGGDFIYAAGGNPAPSTAAHKYSISGNSWTPIASLPISMAYCGGAFAMGKFYVMGGTTAAASTGLYEYDPVANSWTPKAPVPTAVWFATMSVSNDPGRTKVYSIGGGGGYGTWPATPAVQVYDPATNTWAQETPLPAAYGTNASDYCFDGMAMSAGGYDGVANHAETYQGTGFAGGGPPPNVTIDLDPINGPPPIPPGGGSFDFNATLANAETTPQTFSVWIMVQLPSMSWYGPVLGPLSLTLPASGTITRLRTQVIPPSAPAGAYVYEGRIGVYPGTIWDSDSFPFTKTAGLDGGSVGEWLNTGASFLPENVTLNNYPNPFNPTTTINFSLPVSGVASLTVYDLSGRQVAQLMNGYRAAGAHQVTFDASALASGVYLYRLSSAGQSSIAKMVLTK